MVLLCSTHHDLIHHSTWTVQISGDGLPEFIPPRFIDPQQRPRRNPVHPAIPTPTADPGTPGATTTGNRAPDP